jgi:hypothetical protein
MIRNNEIITSHHYGPLSEGNRSGHNNQKNQGNYRSSFHGV